ncbi:Leucine rich repeat-containing protein [Pseudomonas sp. ok272]|uniref:NEL-type E3 ubiquitin ligase domain-containing protein n=1 Tax=unclassified Pseudomonas TaxID=196821 RepID=UPI0008D2ED7A|nr:MULTISPECIES: NEL-type E3 ubiquitin ligase domain-containing protein [unclassified Pseudomonas]SEN05196.1 Leucine rich repeat-containing protein [Pseudomonas sp. ok272]SFN00974.1 Leucine rich repeat-containing protein [Pseudomonas sp. ok602]
MPTQDDLTHALTQLTQQQLQAALLDMTGDLAKAQVLQKRLPGWMVNAPPGVLEALETDASQVEEARDAVAGRLRRLRSLDEFCSAHLKAYCQARWQVSVDPEKDLFVRAYYEYEKDVLPLQYSRVIKREKHSVLHMALQNFTEDETRVDRYPPESVLQSAAVPQAVIGLTPSAFAQGCRELDLGRLYQQHIAEVFYLNAGEAGDDAYINGVAVDIGWMKTLDVRIDAHIALMRGDISPDSHALVCALLDRNLGPAEAKDLLFHGRPVIWQGLNALDSCLWSVVVFSGRPIADYPQDPCLVYMPNEPRRPFFEYPSLNDFKTYLDLKLEVASYRTFFTGYLGEVDRLGFFSRFDPQRSVGVLESKPIEVSLARHFFATYVGKLQIDARTLAVPVEDVDEQARQQRLLAYLDAGLTLLNLAGFVVPALGLLMTGVAVGQMLGEVYDGIEDWQRGDKEEAFKQLVAVAQNITSMVLFAAGSKVVGKVLTRTRLNLEGYFRELEAVRSSDGNPRFWRADIAPYTHDQRLVDNAVADAQGLYAVGGHWYVKVNGYVHQVAFDARLDQWRAIHRARPTAYRPALLHNGEGAWRFSFERPEEWDDQNYLFSRLEPASRHPALDSRKLRLVNDIMGKPYHWAYHLARECLPFPARFRDLYERFRLEQSIRDLIWLLERGVYLNAESATLQMHVLPLLPGWPEGRYFDVVDAQGRVTARYPDSAFFDETSLRVTLTEQAVKEGQVFDGVLSQLDQEQKNGLLGEGVAAHQEHATLVHRLLAHLKAYRKPLFEQLYQSCEARVPPEWLLIRSTYPQLPYRVMRELMAQASSLDWQTLREQQRVPMALAEAVRGALEEQRLDRALAGFEQPELAGLDTECVAVRLLPRLGGWDRTLQLELRQDSPQGELLALGAIAGARERRVIVRSPAGFQAFDGNALSLSDVRSGPDGLFEAIERPLADHQRIALGLPVVEADNGWRLRRLVAAQVQSERELAAEAFSDQAHEPQTVETPCRLADSPAGAAARSRVLLGKVKRLYPTFSDAQATDLLLACGVDELSRAKAVERMTLDLERLRAILKHWKSNLQDLEYQPGLRDIRHSRQQVAERIEACWRRQSVVLDERQLPVASLTLDDMRVGALPNLPPQIRFDHVRQLSLKNMRLGDDVAYFLKCFKGVKRLDLDRNRLTRLPEYLSRMPELDSLSLARNLLALTEYTRKKLADMSTLRRLDLSHNPLDGHVDVSHMGNLETLLLQDTHITDLPTGLGRLAYLEQADLRDNWITLLPEWLFTSTRSFSQAINLGGNPLAATAMTALARYREDVGIGMGVVEDDQTRFTELKARGLWLPDEVATRNALKRNVWANLRDDGESAPLFELLAQLSGTADSRYVREDLSRRVWEVLQSTHDSVELREQVFQLAAHPVNCADGAADIFSQLEVLMEVERATHRPGRTQGSPGGLLKLGRGLFRLSELEKIARAHATEHASPDPLEVSLAFRVGLAKTLELPGQPKHTQFAAFANVTRDGLEAAHDQVRTAELSPAFMGFIAQLSFWKGHLKQQFPREFLAATEPFDVQQQRLFESRQSLTDGEYLAQMEALRAPRRQAIVEVVERLTQQMIKHQDLGICHVPEG